MQNKPSEERASVNEIINSVKMDDAQLNRLLDSYGVGSQFIDFSGNVIHTPLMNRLHILQCMGINPETPDDLETLLKQRELAAHNRFFPPVLLAHEGQRAELVLTMAAHKCGNGVKWSVILEDGNVRKGEFIPEKLALRASYELHGTQWHEYSVYLEPLPMGYHHLSARQDSSDSVSLLVAAPGQTWQPSGISENKRYWGLSCQLYTLRSQTNWGIGDFTDLEEFCVLAGAAAADFILLNPLHCPDLRYPENASPYSPDDRRFLNPLYIALPKCTEFQAASVQSIVNHGDFQNAIEEARATPNVSYSAVAELKLKVLEQMFSIFREKESTDREILRFGHFIESSGPTLKAFAHFHAARAYSDSPIAADPQFHLYLQWLCQEQLDHCQQVALSAGMEIGLVQDLAVGSIVDGCEVQENLDAYCQHARIGAPPDNFNPDGQNWGLPPLQPDSLHNTGFAHFRALLAANMKACGALRIDHVMSLMRLWWCPDDGSNSTGAYVYYPVDLMFGILRLESQRNRCVVIGEDLGVVPPEIRGYLDSAAIFSNCVFYFEKYDGWHFRKPEDYKRHSLAMIANHDVPPLLCWWNTDDLALRLQIGLIPDEGRYQEEVNWRRAEKGQILQWLNEQQLLPESWCTEDGARELDDELAVALVQACSHIVSSFVSLQLDDLAGAASPINIPGTNTEYPNWRRKLPLATKAIFESNIGQRMLLAMQEGRS